MYYLTDLVYIFFSSSWSVVGMYTCTITKSTGSLLYILQKHQSITANIVSTVVTRFTISFCQHYSNICFSLNSTWAEHFNFPTQFRRFQTTAFHSIISDLIHTYPSPIPQFQVILFVVIFLRSTSLCWNWFLSWRFSSSNSHTEIRRWDHFTFGVFYHKKNHHSLNPFKK